MVLLAILARFGAGRPLPQQDGFAAEVGLAERTLRRRLVELSELGLVYRASRGNRPAEYEIDVAAVRRWCSGEEIVRPDWPDSAATVAGQTGECGVDFGRTLARASSPAASVPSGADPQAGPSGDPGLLDRALVTLQHYGFRTAAPAMRETVQAWLREFSVQDIAWAAKESFDHGSRTNAYMNSVLRGLQVDRAQARAAAGDVVPFEEYRGRAPWGGAFEE